MGDLRLLGKKIQFFPSLLLQWNVVVLGVFGYNEEHMVWCEDFREFQNVYVNFLGSK